MCLIPFYFNKIIIFVIINIILILKFLFLLIFKKYSFHSFFFLIIMTNIKLSQHFYESLINIATPAETEGLRKYLVNKTNSCG